MPTFEEWCSELGFHCGINSVARQAWHARDAELAAKDRTIERAKLLTLISFNCDVTGNLCGTDTYIEGFPCSCISCERTRKLLAALEGKQ